jgi:two-component system, OmpR family, phosphate regulon sensor histidine kinase PhoR
MKMKKIFPLIVVLISLSVIGILFIQMSWIRNTLKFKQDEYERSVSVSLAKITESLQDVFYATKAVQIYSDDYSKDFFLQNNFTLINAFTTEEISEIISQNLRKNNIKFEYDFCVTNIFNNIIFKSPGFILQDMSKAYTVVVSPKDALRSKETLYLVIHENKNQTISEMWWMVAASAVFTFVMILAFYLIVRTLFSQKKVSEIKSDFINNMTHELKTPLATISLAIDALTNEKVIHDTEKIKIYSSMIKEENKRMNQQVEKILQAARLEREEIKLNLQRIDAHKAISKVYENIDLQLKEKNGSMLLRLTAHHYEVYADPVHFSNIIFNLLDNAMKYSEVPPYIELETLNTSNSTLSIKIKDNGIGMDKDTQSMIFEKFYRAHTGNLHNVKGFGLGLSYVKAIVEAHAGKIKVDSTPGKGSTFTITLPLTQDKA